MIPVSFSQNSNLPLKVLCLGAHSDDIEIGCGGTILQLLSGQRTTDIVWVVFSSGAEREREARESAALFLERTPYKDVLVQDFRDGFFPYDAKIKELFEQLK